MFKNCHKGCAIKNSNILTRNLGSPTDRSPFKKHKDKKNISSNKCLFIVCSLEKISDRHAIYYYLNKIEMVSKVGTLYMY